MPHINIQCYPKNLSEQELKTFADELTTFISEKLNTPSDYITINYNELNEADFKKEVWDKQIVPNQDNLLRPPHYKL